MSTSLTTLPKKYDVFLSFRGLDTRSSFITFLYDALVVKNIRTFKDDMELESGQRISPALSRAIKESKFAVVVISARYAASTWCLEELVKIMELEEKGSLTVIPIFYGVEPCDVRWQIGELAAQFKKHEAREAHENVLTWRKALTGLANISGGCSLEWRDDLMLIDEVVKRIWRSTTTTIGNGSNIVGINEHMKAISRLIDLNSKETVRVVGIWARGGNGRSALSNFVYQKICQHFQSHCFMGNLKRISQDHHMSHLHKEFMASVQGEYCSSRSRFENQKVLLVADNVNKLEQLDALAEDFNCFGSGSIVIITTQDKQLLSSYGIELVYEVECLKFKKVPELLRQLSFRKIDIFAGFGSGSFLRDDGSKLVDGITKNVITFEKLFSATPTDGQIFRSLGFKEFSITLTDGQFFRSSGFKKRDGPTDGQFFRTSRFKKRDEPTDGQFFRSSGFKKRDGPTDGMFFRSSGFKKRDGPTDGHFFRSSGFKKRDGSNNGQFFRSSGFKKRDGPTDGQFFRSSGFKKRDGTIVGQFFRSSGFKKRDGSTHGQFFRSSGFKKRDGPTDRQFFRSSRFKKRDRRTGGQFFRLSGFKKRDKLFGLEQSTYIEP